MANPLQKYYAQISGLTGFNPERIPSAGAEVMDAVAQRNDPSSWVAYSATAIRGAWAALPDDTREDMYNAISEVIDRALDNAANITDGMAEAAATVNSLPVIGQILGMVIKVVGEVYGGVKQFNAINAKISAQHKAQRILLTFGRYDDPREWVFQSMKLANYSQFVSHRAQGNWSREPCFQRAGLGTNKMFVAKAGTADVGKCGHMKGVKVRCPSHRDLGYEDCKRYYTRESKNPSHWCHRSLAISSLWYPYWSPSYAAGPIANIFQGQGEQDPNGILMGRQMMLLADPYSNLRVIGDDVRAMSDQFVAYWRQMMGVFAVDGKLGLLHIDEDGNAPGTAKADRYTVDEEEDPKYTGASELMNRFYFDDVGRIQPYQGMGARVNEWGIRTVDGAGKGKDGGSLAVSIGAYNAVVTNTLAFFTARANMLRNGSRMRGLLQDHPVKTLDPAVQAAVQYASAEGGMLPPPPPAPTRQLWDPAVRPKRAILRPGGVDGKSKGIPPVVPLAAAGAAAIFLLPKVIK